MEGNQRAGAAAPAPIGSAVEGLPGGLLRYGISPQRGACLWPAVHSPAGGFGFLLPLRKLSPPKDLRVLHQAVGDGGGDGRVVKDVAPVGEGCFGGNERRAL